MKKSKITQKDVLFLSISMFIVVVAWIAFSIYHSIVTTTITEDLQMQIVPIDPRFDTEIIEKLKSREKVIPLFEVTGTQQASTPAIIEPSQTLIEEPLDETEETILEEEPTPTESEPTPAI